MNTQAKTALRRARSAYAHKVVCLANAEGKSVAAVRRMEREAKRARRAFLEADWLADAMSEAAGRLQ